MKEKNDIKLWLAWKDPNTRQRFVVGQLWYDSKYRFQYFEESNQNGINNCGLDLAEMTGFRKLEPFQSLQVYSNDTLFQVFNRRLPDRSRPDFDDLVKEYKLKPDCTPLELLEATGGRLATDTLEFVAPFTFEEKGEFEIEFYIAGWRHYNGESVLHELKPQPPLKLAWSQPTSMILSLSSIGAGRCAVGVCASLLFSLFR